MNRSKILRPGILAAEALEVICNEPEKAYAYAITQTLNKRHGEGHTHNLEVGNALQLLAGIGILEEVPRCSRESGRRRKMFAPTWMAGLLIGLKGAVVEPYKST